MLAQVSRESFGESSPYEDAQVTALVKEILDTFPNLATIFGYDKDNLDFKDKDTTLANVCVTACYNRIEKFYNVELDTPPETFHKVLDRLKLYRK